MADINKLADSLLQESEIITAETTLPSGLVLPGIRRFNPPAKSRPNSDGPLPIRYIEGKHWEAFLINMMTLVMIGLIVWFIIMLGLRKLDLTAPAYIRFGIPLVFMWFVGFAVFSRGGTTVEARKAKVYLDTWFNEILVYMKGFHFVVWFAIQEADDVNFQKTEKKTCLISEGKGITFQSGDGYELAVDLTFMWKRRSDPEAMSYSLQYETDTLSDWLMAVVVSRLSDLGGCNDYETLLKNKPEVTAWVANIFGGENNKSPMEIETGTEAKNPIAGNLDLTDGSKQIRASKAKAELLAKYTKHFIDEVGLSPKDAAISAQLATELATRSIVTYEGIPDGATFVALGDQAMAATVGKKGK